MAMACSIVVDDILVEEKSVTLKIYGPTASRAARALWIVHELGIPFEHVPMEMKDLKGPDYLKINPNGKVPALVEDGFKLFADRWNPILDVFQECGVKFALEVHPTDRSRKYLEAKKNKMGHLLKLV